MSVSVIVAGCAAVATAAAAAFFVARSRAKAKRAEDAARAQDRMSRVASRDLPSTARRLRGDADF